MAENEGIVPLCAACQQPMTMIRCGRCDYEQKYHYDYPGADGTDAAHPAWWRGNDRGVEAAIEAINKVLDDPEALVSPSFGGRELRDLVNRILLIRNDKEAAKFWDAVFHASDYKDKNKRQKIQAELADFHFILEQVPKVYCHVTGDQLSKPNYFAEGVISEAEAHMQKLIEEAVADAREEWETDLRDFDRTPWIGVDLDGTLAQYNRGDWQKYGHLYIGEPIMPMVARVKDWIAEGKRVKIVTARCGLFRKNEDEMEAIHEWIVKHVGTELEITCVKDYAMVELWDDRAVQVISNTGARADERL